MKFQKEIPREKTAKEFLEFLRKNITNTSSWLIFTFLTCLIAIGAGKETANLDIPTHTTKAIKGNLGLFNVV